MKYPRKFRFLDFSQIGKICPPKNVNICDRLCINQSFAAFFENELLTPLESWMSAEGDSVSTLALLLMVAKLCARMYTRVAVIDFEK